MRFALETVLEASECYDGFCIECGESHSQCEPDLSEGDRKCDQCGEMKVVGAEELFVLDLVD